MIRVCWHKNSYFIFFIGLFGHFQTWSKGRITDMKYEFLCQKTLITICFNHWILQNVAGVTYRQIYITALLHNATNGNACQNGCYAPATFTLDL